VNKKFQKEIWSREAEVCKSVYVTVQSVHVRPACDSVLLFPVPPTLGQFVDFKPSAVGRCWNSKEMCLVSQIWYKWTHALWLIRSSNALFYALYIVTRPVQQWRSYGKVIPFTLSPKPAYVFIDNVMESVCWWIFTFHFIICDDTLGSWHECSEFVAHRINNWVFELWVTVWLNLMFELHIGHCIECFISPHRIYSSSIYCILRTAYFSTCVDPLPCLLTQIKQNTVPYNVQSRLTMFHTHAFKN
jgi:hypothetical protein